jgi:uncharacterized protein YbdZ (MbtH family)
MGRRVSDFSSLLFSSLSLLIFTDKTEKYIIYSQFVRISFGWEKVHRRNQRRKLRSSFQCWRHCRLWHQLR